MVSLVRLSEEGMVEGERLIPLSFHQSHFFTPPPIKPLSHNPSPPFNMGVPFTNLTRDTFILGDGEGRRAATTQTLIFSEGDADDTERVERALPHTSSGR
jgi:hypothetical protein